MPRPPMPEKTRKRILELHVSGLPLKEVAKQVGFSHNHVFKTITDAGYESHKSARKKENTEKISSSLRQGGSFEEIANRAGVSRTTVRETLKKATHKEPDIDQCPPAIKLEYNKFHINEQGQIGIINDLHLPAHDEATLMAFARECKRRMVRTIVLNGDTLDSHEVSDHDKDPSMDRYEDEIVKGRDLLQWLRNTLPKARIIWKDGNHEERVYRYLLRRAAAVALLKDEDETPMLSLDKWLLFKKFGIEYVTDGRIIKLGKHLNLLHGHELGRGAGGVHPARTLHLRAGAIAACGHFHRPNEYHDRTIEDEFPAAWSIGCACWLKPAWIRVNKWNHGFAFVELDRDGGFHFENRRVLNGKLV